LSDFPGSNFYPFSPFLAMPLSGILPTFSVSLFFRFTKVSEYNNQYIKYLIKEKLATNYFTGK